MYYRILVEHIQKILLWAGQLIIIHYLCKKKIMRTKSPTNSIEYQRNLCVKLDEESFTQVRIAKIIGKTQGWVSQVLSKFKKGGLDELKEKKAKGASPKLTETQKQELSNIIDKGALAYGFEGDIWTRKRVQLVIKEQYNVQYSERHVGKILQEMRYSKQIPQEIDYRQKQELVDEWV